MKNIYVRNIPNQLYLKLIKLKINSEAKTWKDLFWIMVDSIDSSTILKEEKKQGKSLIDIIADQEE